MRIDTCVLVGALLLALTGCSDPSGLGTDSGVKETVGSRFLGGGASVTLQKTTNGHDADVGPGPLLAPGDPVVWEYRVVNTGTETLTGLVVMDDPEGLVCGIETLPVGGEVVCSLTGEAIEGPYENVGTVWGYAFLSMVQASDPSHYEGGVETAPLPSVMTVDVRIKPGEDLPCINGSSKGRTPVAVLGSSVFDPWSVDPSTLMAGGLVSPVRWGVGEDVNQDGQEDLVIHFKTPELNAAGLLEDGSELVVSGETTDGVNFEGADLVRLAGGPLCR